MQIVYFDGRDRHELDVRVNNPSATVDDLVVALDPRGGERTLLIGDHPADPDFALTEAGLHEGAVVRFGPPRAVDRGVPPPPAPVPGGAPGRELVVVNGLDAGRRFPLVPGTLVIGRAPGCEVLLRDGTLSRRHAGITTTPDGEVTIEDYGSHNGTWVAGEAVLDRVPLAEGVPLRLGALDLEVRAVRDDDRPVAVDPLRHTTAAGTIPFNRPPRPAPPPPTPEQRAPQAPKSGQGKVPFSLLGCLAPLALAGGMYATTKSPQMLMFAALTPIMAVANAIDGRRKGRKSERSEKERFAREMVEFRERLAGVVDAERSRREQACPDPAEIVRRVVLPSTMLWERRLGHADFLSLRAGVGDVPWRPPIPDVDVMPDAPDELRAALDEHALLAGSPVPVDLSEGGVVGIVGDRPAALALARSLLCQAAILHGPADLPAMILARPETAPAWDWAKWLPHTRDSSGSGRMLSSDPEMSTRMVDGRLKAWAASERSGPRSVRREARPTGPPLLVVVDDELLTEGRKAPTRSLLRGEGGPVAGIVIASTADRLPAVCTTVVDMTDPDGGADLTLPQRGEHISGFLPAGMADDVARECARALARFEDPELDLVGAGLPATIRLLPLLEMEECTPDAVLARWKAAGPDPRPAGPVGVTEDGVFSVDFVADGPHGLVGGTTGAGKSELLRTLVASLAASVDPDHLTFVLIDFKGGSAFDECARLPHTVGMVTDLDEHLAERALRCLEAELKYRERVLREAAAVDLPDYLRKGLSEPMPRLLVIIDEFATLKAELPEFIDALVGVAQRGRSLGVHMLLATQRPQGAINDNIKANTNMRIALRVQEDGDSRDIIDVTDAAAIPRTAPGRAYVRLGPNEVVAIQSALSTGSRDSASLAHVDVARFLYGPSPRQEIPPPPVDPAAAAVAGEAVDGVPPPGQTDLALLVSAIREAFAATGRAVPRRPWPDPLPADIDLDALIDASIEAGRAQVGPGALGFVPLALADDPEAQAQYPVGWHRHEGNLVVYGIGGSGTTTALTSLALSLARTQSPDDLHMYALDFGAGELGAIAPLPHVGAVILAAERERQTRLMRYLRAELDRRRDLGAAAVRSEPAIVTLVDGWTSLVSEYNDLAGSAHWEAFTRVFADGPEVGLFTVVAADRAGAVSHALASLVRQRLALRLGDKGDYSNFGIRMANVPDMVPGRAITIADRQVVQIARPAGGAEAAAGRLASSIPPPARPPVRMDVLTTEVRLPELGAVAGLGARPWTIPIGVAESARATAHLVAYQGEHALIVGPARSGKSTALLTVAAACRAARGDVRVVAVAGPRSPIGADPLVDQAIHPNQIGEGLMPLAEPGDGLVLVLVDDAEAIDDVGSVLDKLSTSDRADLLFVAAGRNDGVRTGYSHWTRPLRRSKLGVMLRPDVDLDGDIFGTRLPRRSPVAMVAGRGYLAANGNVELVQVALPR